MGCMMISDPPLPKKYSPTGLRAHLGMSTRFNDLSRGIDDDESVNGCQYRSGSGERITPVSTIALICGRQCYACALLYRSYCLLPSRAFAVAFMRLFLVRLFCG